MAANAKLGSNLSQKLGCLFAETKLRKNETKLRKKFGHDLKHFNSVERDDGKSVKEYFTVNWRL
jgi:hypothetical protein